ncbi:hypothetical protein D3C76_1595970 [compost metagenome]
MGIKKSARRPQRQHRPGKFRNRQLRAFNMAVAVKQSGCDIFAGCINNLRVLSNGMSDILPDIGDAPPLHRNVHPLQYFSGNHIDQLPSRYNKGCLLIAACCCNQLRHTIRQRFSFE